MQHNITLGLQGCPIAIGAAKIEPKQQKKALKSLILHDNTHCGGQQGCSPSPQVSSQSCSSSRVVLPTMEKLITGNIRVDKDIKWQHLDSSKKLLKLLLHWPALALANLSLRPLLRL